MGIFCLPPIKTDEDNTPEECIEAVIDNIKMFVEMEKEDFPNDYLLTGFAIGLLEQALGSLEEKKESEC